MGLQLLEVEFSFFAAACPDDRVALGVDFHHQGFCLGVVIAEDFHQHPSDIAHQVDGVIVDDDIPWGVKCHIGQ